MTISSKLEEPFLSETNALLTILEKTVENSHVIIQALERIAQKQDENALILAKAIGENSLALGQLLERVVQTTDRTEHITAEILARLTSVQGTSH